MDTRLIGISELTEKLSRSSLFIGIAPVLFLIGLIAALHLFSFAYPLAGLVFEPPLLLPILNTVFVFLASGIVSYIAMRSYFISGSPTLLYLGCGVLALGTGALIAGWMRGLGGNVSATIFNLSALLASIFHIVGTTVNLKGEPPEADWKRRRRKLLVGYIGVLFFVALTSLAAITRALPPFYIQGAGPTALRQAIMAAALVLFSISSLFMMARYIQNSPQFLYWYSLALALSAVNMVGSYLSPAVGSPLAWVARSAQYLAGIYFLIAVRCALGEARRRGVALNEAVAELFRESWTYWQDILATVSDAVVSCDDRGRILQWNQAAEKVFGFSPAEVMGKDFKQLLPGRDALNVGDLTAARMPGGGIMEMELKKKEGSSFRAELSFSAKKLSVGKVVTLIIRDVTERKRAEEEREALIAQLMKERRRAQELAAEAQRRAQEAEEGKRILEALMKHVPTGIAIAEGEDLRIRFMSRYGQILSGLQDHQLAGMTAAALARYWIHPEKGIPADPEEIPLARAIKRGDVTIDEEWVLQRPNGERFHILCNAAPIRDPDGNIKAGVLALSDITTIKIAQDRITVQAKELRRYQDELEERIRERTAELMKANQIILGSEKRLRHLSAALLKAQENERKKIAIDLHDSFAAHLAGIKYQLETRIMQEREWSPLPAEKVGIPLEKITTMVQESIEDVRRITANLRPSVLDDLGILATVNWFCREFQKTYAHIRVESRIEIKEEEISELLKTAIFRVLQEATTNIAKHSGGDRVSLELAKKGNKLQFSVMDNGHGFDLRETLSAKAYRGLGLNSMRERVELSGGKFEIESRPGQGTVIRVEWPVFTAVPAE